MAADEDEIDISDVLASIEGLTVALEAMPVTAELFAAAALQGLLAREQVPYGSREALVKEAWDVAEAMIREMDRRADLEESLTKKKNPQS